MPTFLEDVLRLAVDIELECAAVYETFAGHSADREELSMFWRLYAEAERYHAATIRIHQATFAVGEAVDGDAFPTEVEESRAFLEQLRGWRDQFRTERPTIDAMFDIARSIETNTAELHGRTQFFTLYPSFETLFQQMSEEDEDHRAMLDQAAEKFRAA